MKMKICILAGGPRLAKLARAVGIPTAGLPIAPGVPLVKAWPLDCGGFSAVEAPVLLCSSRHDNPEEYGVSLSPQMKIEYEPHAHRGTGGAIADWIRAGGNPQDPADDDYSHVLVCESSAYPAIDLAAMVNMASRSEYAAVFGMSELGRPAGCVIIRRDLVELIPDRGFFDLKEQWISTVVEAGHRIGACRVVERATRVLSLSDWLAAVSAYEASRAEEDRIPAIRAHGVSCVDPTAVVEGATLSRAIVMRDAIVEPDSIVVRSAIGPGVVISSGDVVVDRVVSASRIPWESVNLRRRGMLS